MWTLNPYGAFFLPADLSIPDLLRPGTMWRGVVENAPDGTLELHVAGARIPVSDTSQLIAGQAVRVDVRQTQQGIQLQVTPLVSSESTGQTQPAVPAPVQASAQASAQPSSASTPAPALADMISVVLESIGAMQNNIPSGLDIAASLVPADFPRNEEALRTLLSLFVTRSSIGEDFAQIANLVSLASASGALPQSVAEEAAAALVLFTSWEPKDIRIALEQLLANTARSSESRIAEALASGKPEDILRLLQGDTRTLVSRLLTNDAFKGFLRKTGQTQVFQDAAERVLDRVTASHLQNLNGREQSYAFLELPCVSGQPVQQAQVHFVSQGGQQKHAWDAQNAVVALDLSMSHLGNLWITLQIVGGRCSCRFCVTTPGIGDVIRHEAPALAKGLENAGYPGAAVHVSVWDGDRLREAARLVRTLSGINVTV